MTRRRRGVGGLALVALVACSGGHHAPPPPTTAAPTTTTATTFPSGATIELPSVPGQTTQPPVAVSPGPASVGGTVADDTGAPVGAATVSLERIVGTRSTSTQVTTAVDGTWGVQGILGGIYRIRAWRPPDLAQPSAAVVFVTAAGPNAAVPLTVHHYTGTTVQASVAPNPPILGELVSIVVSVATASVGTDGVVHQSPQAGAAVAITATGQWSIDGAPSKVAGPDGLVSWEATCEAVGTQALSVTIDGGNPVALTVPDCAPFPTTTTSSSTSPTSSTSSASSSTTPTTLKR